MGRETSFLNFDHQPAKDGVAGTLTISPKHLFVAGLPRSGTTLLELVLSAHEQIVITPETYFIQQWIGGEKTPDAVLNAGSRRRLFALMKGDEKLAAWPHFDLDDFLSLEPFNPGVTFATVLDALFLHYAGLHGKQPTVVGNKKGLYVTSGATVKALFPDARFVFIVRDPRDVTMSIVANFRKGVEATAEDIANRFRRMNKMRSAYGRDVKIIRYEDLVLQPEATCRELAAFAGVDESQSMLQFYLQNRQGERLLANRRSIHGNTQRPFDPELVCRWKKGQGLESEELATVDARTTEMRAQFGYE